MRLQDWFDAARDEIILEDHADDDKPAFRD
ncbi:hypothetical protein PENNAL_c0208G05703, partial [Penicillium nalgiovense]